MLPPRDIVSSGFWYGFISGPFFFENDEGANTTINGKHSSSKLIDWFLAAIDDEDIDNIWFQKDRAAYHTVHATVDMLCRISEIV